MVKNRFKDIRHDHRMNQVEFSDFIGINRSLYNRWENQKTQPELETVLRLAKQLQLPVEAIVFLDEP